MTGFINVNKAQGVSSTREVSVIKHVTKTPCGHMGTLDPMASGVLPVAIGNAARLFDYFLDKRKTYVAEFKFGFDSDTLDTTGELIKDGTVPIEDDILQVLPSLEGEIMQIPPIYSAKNVNGKRGYQLARAGVEFTLPPKKVNVYSVKLVEKTNEDTFKFEIECGGGTYIRSIARDMAQMLKTKAVMSSLIRTKSGVFDIASAVSTDLITPENVTQYIIPTDSVLPFDAIYPVGNDVKKLFNGLSVKTSLAEGLYKIYSEDRTFYGLASVNEGQLKVRTKLC